jgi:hypothetical protein
MPDPAVLEDFLGEEVVDTEGKPIGTFACYWEREEKKALLLGVDIPERSGHTHLVPAQGAKFSERYCDIQVPFSRKQIEAAPCLPCVAEVDDELEAKVWAYYKLPQPIPDPNADPLAKTFEAIRAKLRRIFREDRPKTACGSSSNACESTVKREKRPQNNEGDPGVQ